MAGPAPGSLVPVTPSQAALAEVRAVLEVQAAAVDRLDKNAMRALLPALIDARNELRDQLAAWLRDAPDGDERFTAQQLRRSLLMLEQAIERARQLGHDMAGALTDNARAAGALSTQHLAEQVARFGAAFGESVYPTDLDTAAVIARGDRMLIPRYRTSAARYGNGIADDIRHQLAIGVAKNETWAQMKARLVKHGGPRGMVALRGALGDPGAVAEYIAEGLFSKYRYWAERLVRTEMVQAYNVQHQESIGFLNEQRDPATTAEYVQRWDATLDKRACPICRDLDRRVALVGGTFRGGYKAPPAHPQCRCLVVAWHVSWGDISGEVPAVEDATDPLPALPRVPIKPQPVVKPRRAAGKAPPAVALPDPGQIAAERALELVGAGKLKGARDVLDADLARDGMPQAKTWLPPANRIRTRAKHKALGTNNPRDGEIVIRSDQAQAAQRFARDWKADKAALAAQLRAAADATLTGHARVYAVAAVQRSEGMHTIVHEIFHGHGPLGLHAYRGPGVFAEEMTTEWSARALMHRRYGVPRALYDRGAPVKAGGYRGWATRMVDTVAAEGNLTREAAMEAIEDAAMKWKRLPAGSIATGDEAIDELAKLLPGDAGRYKVALRAIAHRNLYDESP